MNNYNVLRIKSIVPQFKHTMLVNALVCNLIMQRTIIEIVCTIIRRYQGIACMQSSSKVDTSASKLRKVNTLLASQELKNSAHSSPDFSKILFRPSLIRLFVICT